MHLCGYYYMPPLPYPMRISKVIYLMYVDDILSFCNVITYVAVIAGLFSVRHITRLLKSHYDHYNGHRCQEDSLIWTGNAVCLVS